MNIVQPVPTMMLFLLFVLAQFLIVLCYDVKEKLFFELKKRTKFLILNEPIVHLSFSSNLFHTLAFDLEIDDKNIYTLDEHLLNLRNSSHSAIFRLLIDTYKTIESNAEDKKYIRYIFICTSFSRIHPINLELLLRKIDKYIYNEAIYEQGDVDIDGILKEYTKEVHKKTRQKKSGRMKGEQFTSQNVEDLIKKETKLLLNYDDTGDPKYIIKKKENVEKYKTEDTDTKEVDKKKQQIEEKNKYKGFLIGFGLNDEMPSVIHHNNPDTKFAYPYLNSGIIIDITLLKNIYNIISLNETDNNKEIQGDFIYELVYYIFQNMQLKMTHFNNMCLSDEMNIHLMDNQDTYTEEQEMGEQQKDAERVYTQIKKEGKTETETEEKTETETETEEELEEGMKKLYRNVDFEVYKFYQVRYLFKHHKKQHKEMKQDIKEETIKETTVDGSNKNSDENEQEKEKEKKSDWSSSLDLEKQEQIVETILSYFNLVYPVSTCVSYSIRSLSESLIDLDKLNLMDLEDQAKLKHYLKETEEVRFSNLEEYKRNLNRINDKYDNILEENQNMLNHKNLLIGIKTSINTENERIPHIKNTYDNTEHTKRLFNSFSFAYEDESESKSESESEEENGSSKEGSKENKSELFDKDFLKSTFSSENIDIEILYMSDKESKKYETLYMNNHDTSKSGLCEKMKNMIYYFYEQYVQEKSDKKYFFMAEDDTFVNVKNVIDVMNLTLNDCSHLKRHMYKKYVKTLTYLEQNIDLLKKNFGKDQFIFFEYWKQNLTRVIQLLKSSDYVPKYCINKQHDSLLSLKDKNDVPIYLGQRYTINSFSENGYSDYLAGGAGILINEETAKQIYFCEYCKCPSKGDPYSAMYDKILGEWAKKLNIISVNFEGFFQNPPSQYNQIFLNYVTPITFHKLNRNNTVEETKKTFFEKLIDYNKNRTEVDPLVDYLHRDYKSKLENISQYFFHIRNIQNASNADIVKANKQIYAKMHSKKKYTKLFNPKKYYAEELRIFLHSIKGNKKKKNFKKRSAGKRNRKDKNQRKEEEEEEDEEENEEENVDEDYDDEFELELVDDVDDDENGNGNGDRHAHEHDSVLGGIGEENQNSHDSQHSRYDTGKLGSDTYKSGHGEEDEGEDVEEEEEEDDDEEEEEEDDDDDYQDEVEEDDEELDEELLKELGEYPEYDNLKNKRAYPSNLLDVNHDKKSTYMLHEEKKYKIQQVYGENIDNKKLEENLNLGREKEKKQNENEDLNAYDEL